MRRVSGGIIRNGRAGQGQLSLGKGDRFDGQSRERGRERLGCGYYPEELGKTRRRKVG